jgi:hypothetical protein
LWWRKGRHSLLNDRPHFRVIDQSNQVLKLHQLVRQSGCHRWRHPMRLVRPDPVWLPDYLGNQYRKYISFVNHTYARALSQFDGFS